MFHLYYLVKPHM